MDKACILIVEDEGIVALDLKSRLVRLGHNVPAVVGSGEEAIQKAKEISPDLILMDIRLKGDLDGIQVAEKIQAKLDVPLIYLSALADDQTMERARATRFCGYVRKPFEDGALQTAIEGALGRQRACDV